MGKQVSNTTRQVESDPMSFLAEAIVFGSSNAIEAMEARGQKELVESSQIPTELMHGLTEDHLVAMGFVLGPITPGDPMFRSATLPPGWKKKATDHSMWSKIVDEKGRERLSCFYKAASYDRSAHMGGVNRFGTKTDYPDGAADTTRKIYVTDCGERAAEPIGIYADGDWGAHYKAHEAARAWLSENRPDWQSPVAYWDED